MIESLKTKVSPVDIKGYWPLLALLLLVGESIGLLWLFRAEGPTERVAAGSLMTLIVLAFLYATSLAQKRETPVGHRLPEALGATSPAEQTSTPEQIENPEPGELSAPDGSYRIDKPPDNWIVRDVTMLAFAQDSLNISEEATPAVLNSILPPYLRDRRILELRSGKQVSIIPFPGKTKIDGRDVPSALETTFRNRLAVLPMDRAQPPWFISRPFVHNFFVNLGQIVASGTMTLQDVEEDETKRRIWRADLRQRITNAHIDGNDDQDLTCLISLIGIEGRIQDHLLMVFYSTKPGGGDPELDEEKRTLESLVNSFKPMEVPDVGQREQEIDELAKRNYEQILAEVGERIFFREFSLALGRLEGEDLNDYTTRSRAIELLRPFEDLAKQVGMEEDEELDELWSSLRQAEEGDASAFKAQVSDLIATLTEQAQAGEDSEQANN